MGGRANQGGMGGGGMRPVSEMGVARDSLHQQNGMPGQRFGMAFLPQRFTQGKPTVPMPRPQISPYRPGG